jgi:hypothetical protein
MDGWPGLCYLLSAIPKECLKVVPEMQALEGSRFRDPLTPKGTSIRRSRKVFCSGTEGSRGRDPSNRDTAFNYTQSFRQLRSGFGGTFGKPNHLPEIHALEGSRPRDPLTPKGASIRRSRNALGSDTKDRVLAILPIGIRLSITARASGDFGPDFVEHLGCRITVDQ